MLRSAKIAAVVPFAAAVLALIPGGAALAVDLAFDPTCHQNAAIDVNAPNTGIVFRKNPGSLVTRAATATIFSINGLQNITIAAGDASCFFAVTETDNYCFQSRNSAAIQNINAVASNNYLGAPACQ